MFCFFTVTPGGNYFPHVRRRFCLYGRAHTPAGILPERIFRGPTMPLVHDDQYWSYTRARVMSHIINNYCCHHFFVNIFNFLAIVKTGKGIPRCGVATDNYSVQCCRLDLARDLGFKGTYVFRERCIASYFGRHM
jgi:hypothetical protein